MMLSKCAEYHWPAIRAHARYYGSISYTGNAPGYVKEFVDAGMLLEISSLTSRKTFVLGVKK